jgi:hypothetical protein
MYIKTGTWGSAMDWCRAERAAVSMTSEKSGPGPDTSQVADYIASAAEELSLMANRHNFVALGFILNMARMEAEQIARGWSDGEAEVAESD